MSIDRQQAQDLARFFRTISDATPAEQAVIDKLNADEDAWIDEATAVLDGTATVTAAPTEGTVTTYTLFSPNALRAAGRTPNMTPRIRETATESLSRLPRERR